MKTGLKKFNVIWVIVTLILMIVSFFIGSNTSRMRRPERLSPEFIIQKLADKLELSETQIDSLAVIGEETRKRREDLFSKERGRFNPMIFFDIIIEGEVKLVEFQGGSDNFRDKMILMDEYTAGQMLKIHHLLNQDQRESLSELITTFIEKNFKHKRPNSDKG